MTKLFLGLQRHRSFKRISTENKHFLEVMLKNVSDIVQGHATLGFDLGSPARHIPSLSRRGSTHVLYLWATAIGCDAPLTLAPLSLRHRGSVRGALQRWTRAALMSLDGARQLSQRGPHPSSLWELPQLSLWTKPWSRTIWNRSALRRGL